MNLSNLWLAELYEQLVESIFKDWEIAMDLPSLLIPLAESSLEQLHTVDLNEVQHIKTIDLAS